MRSEWFSLSLFFYAVLFPFFFFFAVPRPFVEWLLTEPCRDKKKKKHKKHKKHGSSDHGSHYGGSSAAIGGLYPPSYSSHGHKHKHKHRSKSRGGSSSSSSSSDSD